MVVVSYVVILPMLLIALGSVQLVARMIKIEAPKHKYAALDGLRGLLAMFVFLHHAAFWYYVTHFHVWPLVPNKLYNSFGGTSVAMFFMITAFLFGSKLRSTDNAQFDWLKLYISRFLRIVPLYLFAITLVFLFVGLITHFILKEPIGKILFELFQWLFYTAPNVNLFDPTSLINLGVQWSLVYEWLFYGCLPLMGLFLGVEASGKWLLLSGALMAIFLFIIVRVYPERGWIWLSPFWGGIMALFAARIEQIRKVFANRWVSAPLIVLFGFTFFNYPVFQWVPFVSASIFFTGIACGNNLFGLLMSKGCRLLGQISYSIYLLHGLVLFAAFYLIIGLRRSKTLSIDEFWIIIGLVCLLLILLCALTYTYIEKPCIDGANQVAKFIRRKLIKSDKQYLIADSNSTNKEKEVA